MSKKYFIQTDKPEPHMERTIKILKAHPEISKLYGYTPITAVIVTLVVATQIAAGFLLKDQPLWLFFLTAYTLGAAANHSLFVAIHDATHNLVFKTSLANRWIAIFANLPFILPAAMAFREYHLIHHKFQGEQEYDADLAPLWEARLYSHGPIAKAIWFVMFPIHYGITRPLKLKKIYAFDKWAIINTLVVAAFIGLIFALGGWTPVLYMLASSCFAIGFHPLAARVIQEHFVFKEGQETYSYYGPLNKIAYNVGYHNEHHDFMGVPWTNLPKIRAIAPEFYNNLYYHTSWTGLFFKFLFDPKVDFYSRVIRPNHQAKSRIRAEAITAPGGVLSERASVTESDSASGIATPTTA